MATPSTFSTLDPQYLFQMTQVVISIAQTAVLVFTIWYFVRQIGLLRKTLWATQGSEYIKEILDLDRMVVENPKLAKVWAEDGTDDDVARRFYVHMHFQYFDWLYALHREKIMVPSAWETWEVYIRDFMKMPLPRDLWKKAKVDYEDGFAKFVDDLLQR